MDKCSYSFGSQRFTMGTNLNKLFCSGINIWDLNRKFTRLIFWKGGRQIVFPLIKVFRYNFNWRVHRQSVFLTCGELKRLVLSCRLQNSKTSVQSVLFDDKNNSYIVRLWSFGTSWSKIGAWPNVLCSYALWNNCAEVSCKKISNYSYFWTDFDQICWVFPYIKEIKYEQQCRARSLMFLNL